AVPTIPPAAAQASPVRPMSSPTGSSAAASDEQQGVQLTLRAVADVPLAGGPTRFDYQVLDVQAHRLYIAHLGDSLMTVLDTRARQVVKDIRDIKDVHGVVLAPDLGRAFASATGVNQVAVIDTTTLSVVATAPGGDYPDG